MVINRTCERCGAAVGRHAPGQNCAPCLFAAGILDWGPNIGDGIGGSAGSLGHCGDYELLEEISRGGMGVVYRARQIGLRRIVALKMVLAGQFACEAERKRFHREAEAAAQLDHPNIVPIYEVGEQDGRQFFSMKFIGGGTLAERLDLHSSTLPAEDAARLTAKVARAVHYAHQRGVLHRDLKPGNILLDECGEPHVSDFGLVKCVEGNSAATASGAVLGSPSYMAPEQALGKTHQITASADVYSLGAILYEILAGQPPFRADTPLATLKLVVEKEPRRPTAVNQHADSDLEIICLKCLEKEPACRYSSAEALADDLERWRRHEPIVARRASVLERMHKWTRRNPALAVLTAISLFALSSLLLGLVFIGFRLIAANKLTRVQARDAVRQLVQMHLQTGEGLVDRHDPLRALVYFTEAMRLDSTNAAQQEIHRLRLGSIMQRSPDVAAMFFHSDGVWALEFSADGRRVATGSSDQTARVWDLYTGQALTPPLSHQAPVQVVRFSPDGRRVASMSRDGRARLWDGVTGQPLSPWLEQADFHPASERFKPALHFSPDGATLLAIHGSLRPRLWDCATGQLRRELLHPDVVHDAAFGPDGDSILTGCADGSARLWKTKTGEDAVSLDHSHPVDRIGFSQDGKRLFAVTENLVVHLWDAVAHRRIGEPIQPGHLLFDLAFSPDGQKFATAGWRGPVRIWNAADGYALRALPQEGGVTQIAWSPDSLRLATAGSDGSARIWMADTGLIEHANLPHATTLLQVRFSPDSQHLVTGTANGIVQVWKFPGSRSAPLALSHATVRKGEFSADGRHIVTVGQDTEESVRVWESATPRLIRTLPHSAKVETALFSPDNATLVTAARDGMARLWNWQEGREIAAPLRHPQHLYSARFSPDGRRIVTACNDGAARIWEISTGRLLGVMRHAAPVYQAIFSPDDALIATSSEDHTARLWNSRTGEPVSPPLEHQSGVHRAAFSHDGRWLATACYAEGWAGDTSSYAQIWEMPSGRPLGGRLKHRATVNDLAFSPDGERLVTGSLDQTVQIWDVQTGRDAAPAIRQDSEILQVCFSPDGRRLATGNKRGGVRVWDAFTGQSISPLIPHPGSREIMHVRFSPNGDHLLVISGAGNAWLHSFGTTTLPLDELRSTAHILGGHGLDPHGGLIPLDRAATSNEWAKVLQGKTTKRRQP